MHQVPPHTPASKTLVFPHFCFHGKLQLVKTVDHVKHNLCSQKIMLTNNVSRGCFMRENASILKLGISGYNPEIPTLQDLGEPQLKGICIVNKL